MQRETAAKYIIPFIESCRPLRQGDRVVEVGCGEAGVLEAFLKLGYTCVGVDLNEKKIRQARERQSEYLASGSLKLECQDILAEGVQESLGGPFDVILLKDVIEHIPNQEEFIPRLIKLLKPDGCIFFGFPPWHMPFGGHQQMLTNPVLSRTPYLHLLPKALYLNILKWVGESEMRITGMRKHVETGISIERFESIIKNSQGEIQKRNLYLFNPIYTMKFGLPEMKQLPLLRSIPWLRNFYTTCAYYLISRPSHSTS